ncbi:DUF4333 domain-containing protein [Nocardioides zeae]|uniref:DUF4333 domain-containing protein n=1 Tax=Nocardioides imazamoxiresistens TaxID=3231893 RepID=A0ABU3PS75_9ACTN|nr:DUF4333 domain-containing protein [Nocardioides zeae]MDT9592073.1 DUF4333 domain-containing protein [Nocardioides zeae]
MRRHRGTLAALAALAALVVPAGALLAGCSQELPDFTAAEVADAVAEKLAQSNQTAPQPIECGGLEAEADAGTSCTYVLGDRSQDAEVLVTDVADEQVEFSIDVTRTYLTADQLTAAVGQQLSEAGSTGEVVCLDALDLEDGARVYCAQVEGETTVDLAVTAASDATEPIALDVEADDRAASENGQ